jgi:hypothetical protein
VLICKRLRVQSVYALQGYGYKEKWKSFAQSETRLQESFINVFPVPYFYNKDDKSIIMNFINNPIVTRSHFMKRIITFHFGGMGGRQIFGNIIYLFF